MALMMSPAIGVSEAYKKLQACAASLNEASDELGRAIAECDVALKKLNLGIVAWVNIFEDEDINGEDFVDRGIGYAKVGGKWGIALRSRWGNRPTDTVRSEEWMFNDAPRSLRAEAVEKLPALLMALAKRADDTTADIEAKTVKARDFAAAIKSIPARRK
jgi:hypothetical protein